MGGRPDQRCTFCMGGNRCDFCSNGPCRADADKDKRGVCGITADGMAMRSMVLRNVMGTTNYQFHADNAMRTFRETAEGKTPFTLREVGKMRELATRLGVNASGTDKEVAMRLADFVTEDFNRNYTDESRIVQALAPPDRQELWRKLGIFPGGIHSEVMMVTASCLTNVDGNYVTLALKAMRLGIAMAYQSQIMLESLQDVLFGIPRPHEMRVDLGVLDPDYVNILPNGHEPFLGFALVQEAQKEEWQNKAKAAGAKGLRIIANIETGQEMIQRWPMNDIFYGYTGNWISQEPVLATGAVDVFVADMNCSLPADPQYAERYKFRLVPVSEVVNFEGAVEHMNYQPHLAQKQAAELLQMGVDNFRQRHGKVEGVRGLPTGMATVGFSTESILEALGGTLDPLLEAIKGGALRGVVGLVSCTTLRDHAQDAHQIAVANELIKRDILVLSMGCGNAAMQVAGLCSPQAREQAGPGLRAVCEKLGIPPVLSYGTCTDTGRLADLLAALSSALNRVPVSDLPVAAAAPQYMEQKATIDAIFALAFGLYTYVYPVPPVGSAPNLIKLLTSEIREVTGGVLNMERDPAKAADLILEHIEAKRTALGL